MNTNIDPRQLRPSPQAAERDTSTELCPPCRPDTGDALRLAAELAIQKASQNLDAASGSSESIPRSPGVPADKMEPLLIEMRSFRGAFWNKLLEFPCVLAERLETLSLLEGGKLRYQQHVFCAVSAERTRSNILSAVRAVQKKLDGARAANGGTLSSELAIEVLQSVPMPPEVALKTASDLIRKAERLTDLAKLSDSASTHVERELERRRLEHELGGTAEVVARKIQEMVSLRAPYLLIREHVFLAHRRLAFLVVQREYRRSPFIDDVTQVAQAGLIKAIERFDFSRGSCFSTGAYWAIRHEIQTFCRHELGIVHIPANVVSQLKQIRHEISFVRSDERKAEFAKQLSLPMEVFEALLKISRPMVAMDASDKHGRAARDSLPDRSCHEDFQADTRLVARSVIEKGLATLSRQQEEVLRRRFGLGDAAPETLEAIAKTLKVTKERVRQIESTALSELGLNSYLNQFYQENLL